MTFTLSSERGQQAEGLARQAMVSVMKKMKRSKEKEIALSGYYYK